MRRIYVNPWDVLQLRGARPFGFALWWMVAAAAGFFLPVLVPSLAEHLIWRAGAPVNLLAVILSPVTWGPPEHMEVGPFMVSMAAMWLLGPIWVMTTPPRAAWRYLLFTAGVGWLLQLLLFPVMGDVFFTAHYIPLAVSYAVAASRPGQYIGWGNYGLGTTGTFRLFLWIGVVISLVVSLANGRSALPSIGSLAVLLAARHHFWPGWYRSMWSRMRGGRSRRGSRFRVMPGGRRGRGPFAGGGF